MTDNQSLVNAQQLTDIDQDAKQYINAALSLGTRKLYRSNYNMFVQHCDIAGCSALPATSDTVIRYITAQANAGIKPATLITRLAAIRLAHQAKGYDSPTDHVSVKALIKGIKRTIGCAPKRKAAATADRIEAMISYCNTDTLTGLRDKAILLLGFAGAFRRSELIAIDINDLDRTTDDLKITIRRSKSDQEGYTNIIPILNGTKFRVVDTLYHYIQKSKIQNGKIFTQIKKGGKIQNTPLTPRTIANIVKKYANLAGYNQNDFSGHSLRSGFITSGAQAGADIFKLMEVSRHKKPETVLGYIRDSKLFDNHAGEKFL